LRVSPVSSFKVSFSKLWNSYSKKLKACSRVSDQPAEYVFFLSVATSHGLIAEFRFLTTADISFSVSTSHQLSPVLSSKLLSKWGGSRMSRAYSLYKSVWLGYFYYFFNIPTHTPIMYTLKTRKFTLKRLKTHNICSYMFRSIFLDYFQGVRGQYFMQLLSWDRLMYARFTSLILHILLTL